jgi:hypothetical protein
LRFHVKSRKGKRQSIIKVGAIPKQHPLFVY